MSGFRNADGEIVVRTMIASIKEHAAELSEIDGAIGDGDHGINMRKGFSMCEERLGASPGSFTDGVPGGIATVAGLIALSALVALLLALATYAAGHGLALYLESRGGTDRERSAPVAGAHRPKDAVTDHRQPSR